MAPTKLVICPVCGTHRHRAGTCPGCGDTPTRADGTLRIVARAGKGSAIAAALLGTALACGTGDRTRNGDTGTNDVGPQPAYGMPADVSMDVDEDADADVDPDVTPDPNDIGPQPAYGMPADATPEPPYGIPPDQ